MVGPMFEMKPIKQNSLNSQVKERIGNYILTNKLVSGTKLPSERDLAEILNVSRSIVREALKSLEAVGLIEIKVGSGIYVSKVNYSNLFKSLSFTLMQNSEDLHDLIEMRAMFEIAILELIVNKIDDEDVENLEAIIKKFEKAEKLSEASEADAEFHIALVGITGNPLLVEYCSPIINFFSKAREVKSADLSGRPAPEDVERHKLLLEALKNGDLNYAKQVMKEHILSWKDVWVIH